MPRAHLSRNTEHPLVLLSTLIVSILLQHPEEQDKKKNERVIQGGAGLIQPLRLFFQLAADRSHQLAMNHEEEETTWPDSFLCNDKEFDAIIERIKQEERQQRQWMAYYHSMDVWEKNEQLRLAIPTVADVAEHWDWSSLKPSNPCGP